MLNGTCPRWKFLIDLWLLSIGFPTSEPINAPIAAHAIYFPKLTWVSLTLIWIFHSHTYVCPLALEDALEFSFGESHQNFFCSGSTPSVWNLAERKTKKPQNYNLTSSQKKIYIYEIHHLFHISLREQLPFWLILFETLVNISFRYLLSNQRIAGTNTRKYSKTAVTTSWREQDCLL